MVCPSFETGTDRSVIMDIASRFNHACQPKNNVSYKYDERRGVLNMTTIKRISAGTELLICYGGSPDSLYLRFGFQCACGACAGLSDDAYKRANDIWTDGRSWPTVGERNGGNDWGRGSQSGWSTEGW